MSEQSQGPVEWFQPNGRTTGVVMLVLWAVIAVFVLTNGASLALLAALLLAAVLTYATMLRPRIGTTAEHLVYREMFSDLTIPLVRIESVQVTRYFEATVDGHRYVSPALNRSRRSLRASRRGAPVVADAAGGYADLVEDTMRARIADARARRRGAETSEEVRRTWAHRDICASAVAVMLLILLLVI